MINRVIFEHCGAGEIHFSEVIMQFAKRGAAYYFVDDQRGETTHYFNNGEHYAIFRSPQVILLTYLC